MKTKYSPDFKAMFDALPPATQAQFRAIDAKVKAGDLSIFDRQGWAYFVDVDDNHTAMGSHREADGVFYWMLIASPQQMPVIL